MGYDQKVLDRFWQKVEKLESGCWNWLGANTFQIQKKPKRVGLVPRRFAYLISVGPVANEQILLSKCGRTWCVNPEHQNIYEPGNVDKECHTCGKAVRIGKAQHARSKTGKAFCSRTCATIENNKYKGKAWGDLRDRSSVRAKWIRSGGSLVCTRCPFDGTEKPWCIELDHIIRIADGGTHTEDNLQPLCLNCHMDKCVREMKKS